MCGEQIPTDHADELADCFAACLRQSVVKRSRSVLRHRGVIDRKVQRTLPETPGTTHDSPGLLEGSAALAALRDLPERQREAILLRYYAGLPESEIAAAMGISRGAVQSHTARGCPCFARLSNRPTRNPPIPATATRAVSARCRPRRRSGPRSRSGR